MNRQYQPELIEKLAQDYWNENRIFGVKEDLNKEKYYCLSMLPYPSGNLHMGHVRNYTLGDLISRYQRMLGKHVLQPMGWDAFGLPAENAAIAHKQPPSEWTRKNIKKMRKQFEMLGMSYDWQREIATCDASYYRWEQWLFIQLFKKGLIYKKNAVVNWDPVDHTVLANEQVVDGKGWRSGAVVERKEIPQWFIKITDYAGELLTGLDKLTEWPEQVIRMQKNWIGRSEGVNIHFPLVRRKSKLTVFTTRADTLMGVTYIAIASDHPLAKEAAEKDSEVAKFIEECRHIKVSEAEVATQEKKGICLKIKAIHPLTQDKLPIWIANFVVTQYGAGAVMGVPAHDQRDFEFAQKYNLPIRQVILPINNEENESTDWDFQKAAFTLHGKLINSSQFNDLDSEQAINTINDFLIKKKLAELQVHYRIRDWGISRQRYWGTPIPMIYCKQCGDLPVPEADLPVILPEDLVPDGHGSPLVNFPSFYKTKCPRCGKTAKRETDTMDTFVESSWYYARYCSYNQDKAMLDDRAKYWTPVDQYVGGVEHAVMHLLYARFMHKLLRDLGLLNSDEPFKRLLTQGMVLKKGSKMSKSKGNVVSPEKLIKQYGADTVRLFIIFAAPPEQALEWSDSGVEGCYRFLKKLYTFAIDLKDKLNTLFPSTFIINHNEINDKRLRHAHQQIHQILQQATNDIERKQYNTVVSAAMKIFNIISKIDSQSDIETRIIQKGLNILLRILAPIIPHLSHTLWQELGYGENILDAGWPKINNQALQVDDVELVVQINGKMRGKIVAPYDASEDLIKKHIMDNEQITRHLNDKNIKKMIVVANKLVNLVI